MSDTRHVELTLVFIDITHHYLLRVPNFKAVEFTPAVCLKYSELIMKATTHSLVATCSCLLMYESPVQVFHM